MADSKREPRAIVFSGGVFSDMPATERPCEDLENLLSPMGGGKGLEPRDGIKFLIKPELSESDTGIHIYEIENPDDMTRTTILACIDVATGEVRHLTDHTDQEGRKSIPPLGGGTLPVTPEPEPDYVPWMRFDSATAYGDAGDTLMLTVSGNNVGGTCGVGIDMVTAEDGVDVNDGTGSVTANGITSGIITIPILGTARDGKKFDVYLDNPTNFIKNPSRCRVTIGAVPYENWRPLRIRAVSGNPNLAVLELFNVDTEEVRLEDLDWSGMSGVIPNGMITTPDKLIVWRDANDANILIFDLTSIGNNPGDTHTPTVWGPVFGVFCVWADAVNNVAILDMEYNLRIGSANSPTLPGIAQVIDTAGMTGFTSFQNTKNNAQGIYTPIVAGGWMLVEGNFSDGYGVCGIKADGTVADLSAAFPHDVSWPYWMLSTDTGGRVFSAVRSGSPFPAALDGMKGAADVTSAQQSVTTSGFDAGASVTSYALTPAGDKAFLATTVSGTNGYSASVSGFGMTKIAGFGGTADTSFAASMMVNDTFAGFIRETDNGATYDVELQRVVASTGAISSAVQISTGTAYSGQSYLCVYDPFAYSCINAHALIGDGA